jgi:SNF2 family DNA or RNA helicase
MQLDRPIVHRARQAVLMPVAEPYVSAFPHARHVQPNGKPAILAVKHTLDVARVLENIGVEAPSPIELYYDWSGGTPFEAQKETAKLLVSNFRGYVLNALGTGKTRAALYAIDYLKRAGAIKRALVLAPLSTLTVVWEREIAFNFPTLKPAVFHGSRQKRIEMIEDPSWDVGIINHDGLHTVISYLVMARVGAIVVDELTAFRSRKSRRWKTANTLTERAPYVWGMTGAPTPNSLLDAWAQVRLITPTRVPSSSNAFRDSVLTRISPFRYLPKPEGARVVAEAMQPAVRFTRDQVVELPPVTYIERQVPMEPMQARAYKEMRDRCYAKFQAGEVTAVNAGVLLSKLMQVAGGAVYSDTRGVIKFPCQSRLNELELLVEEADAKVIVYCAFRHLVDIVHEHLSKRFQVAAVHGDVSAGQRTAIFNAFQDEADPHVLVAHPQCMAHGLTLTAADMIVWWGPVVNNEHYEQANARITRPGQVRHQIVAHLHGSPEERRVYRMMREKASIQGSVLSIFERMGE